MSAREQPRALFSFFICIYRFFCVPLQPKVAKMMNESLLLRARIGRGYSRPNLNNMRKYYLLFPKCQTTDKLVANFQTTDKLTWSHICELITIDDDLEREFYAKECVAENSD